MKVDMMVDMMAVQKVFLMVVTKVAMRDEKKVDM